MHRNCGLLPLAYALFSPQLTLFVTLLHMFARFRRAGFTRHTAWVYSEICKGLLLSNE